MSNQVIRLVTEQELRSIMTEVYVDTTQVTTKVTDNSVLGGLISGNSKVGKKALKDIALAVSHLFPDDASGSALDEVAANYGIAPRLGSSQSSGRVRVVGNQGTIYTQGVNTVFGNNGVVFDLQESVTLGSSGFAYIKIRSQAAGEITNVNPYTINSINPTPSGHVAVINEYVTEGGRDAEQDDVFRQRIKEGPNILSRNTLSYLTQVFIKFEPNVLKVDFNGINQQGKVVLSILTQNGIDLLQPELDSLLLQAGPYLALTELNAIGTLTYGAVLQNTQYYYIDTNFRVQLFDNFDIGAVAKDIQVGFSKYVDFRFWDASKQKIEWTVLLDVVKATNGVKYVPDTYFSPSVDITVPVGYYPRFRGFQAYDLNGAIILNNNNTISPIFYPTEIANDFVITVL